MTADEYENRLTGFPVALVRGQRIVLDGHYAVTVDTTHMCNNEADLWAYIMKRRAEEQLPPLEVRELNLEPYRESCGREAESDERVAPAMASRPASMGTRSTVTTFVRGVNMWAMDLAINAAEQRGYESATTGESCPYESDRFKEHWLAGRARYALEHRPSLVGPGALRK